MLSEKAIVAKSEIVRDVEVNTSSLDEGRLEWNTFAAAQPLPSEIEVESLVIESVNCEYISRKNQHYDGTIMWFHGGGYVTGSCITHRQMAAKLALRVNYKVLLFDYGLAPEAPYPQALNQALAIYKTLKAEEIIFVGDSAGGGLALATSLKLKSVKEALPKKLVLLSPWTDLSLSGPSMIGNYHKEPMLTLGDLATCAHRYLVDTDPKDVYVSPLFGQLEGLPETLIHVGTDEILLDDSLRLYDKMNQAGLVVHLKEWTDLWHCFHGWDIPEADKAFDEIARFIQ